MNFDIFTFFNWLDWSKWSIWLVISIDLTGQNVKFDGSFQLTWRVKMTNLTGQDKILIGQICLFEPSNFVFDPSNLTFDPSIFCLDPSNLTFWPVKSIEMTRQIWHFVPSSQLKWPVTIWHLTSHFNGNDQSNLTFGPVKSIGKNVKMSKFIKEFRRFWFWPFRGEGIRLMSKPPEAEKWNSNGFSLGNPPQILSHQIWHWPVKVRISGQILAAGSNVKMWKKY